MGATAENLHDRFPQITKEDADAFAVRSQQRAAAAWANGVMRETVVPMTRLHRRGLEGRRPRRVPSARHVAGGARDAADAVPRGRPRHRRQLRRAHRRRDRRFLAAEETAAELGLEPKMRLVGVRVRGRRAGADGHRPDPGDEARARAGRAHARRRRPLRAERAVRRAGADLVRRHGRRPGGSAPQPVRRRDRLRPSARRDRRAPDGAARVRLPRAARRALRADRALRRHGHGRGACSGRTLAPVTEFKLTRAGDVALVTIDNGEDWTKPTFFGAGRARVARPRCSTSSRAATSAPRSSPASRSSSPPAPTSPSFPDITRRARARGRARRATSCSAGCARCRSRRSRRSTAPASAAASSSRSTARRARSRPPSATSRFPEVFLGLFPAWGGTQLLPRLVGAGDRDQGDRLEPAAAEPDADGAGRSSELGIADRLLEPVEFVDESLAFARELADQPLERADAGLVRRRDDLPPARATSVDDAVHGAAPAPYAALDLIEGAQRLDARGGLPRARRKRSASSFPARRRRRRSTRSTSSSGARRGTRARPTATPRRVQQGRHRRRRPDGAADRDAVPAPARGSDRHPRREAGDRRRGARGHPRRDRGQVAKGRYDEGKARFLASLVSGGTDYDGFADCDLVLEAVFEELEVKKRGVRRARASRARRVRARDEHVGALDHRDGGRPASPRARRGHALLQPGRADAARRGRARRRDGRRGARDRLGRRREAAQARRSSSTTRPASSSTAC